MVWLGEHILADEASAEILGKTTSFTVASALSFGRVDVSIDNIPPFFMFSSMDVIMLSETSINSAKLSGNSLASVYI